MPELLLKRHSGSPVLLPDPTSDWECYNVFNPAVVYHDGLFHMFYRAQGLDLVSRIGYAVSSDGVSWNRLRRPVVEPIGVEDSRGVEDPRVTEISGTFYMTYTAFGSKSYSSSPSLYDGGGITPMIARSSNLISWERLGSLVRGEDNKDHVLFPRKLRDQYAAFHRRRPDVWLAYSADLLGWPHDQMKRVFGPRRENMWDSTKVGANGPPIATEQGWLLMYHGTDANNVYRFGVCLLDLEEPSRLIRRPRRPIFEPVQLWELKGYVPNVIFSCANPVVAGTVHVFYGAGDHVVGLATCSLDDLLEFALRER